MVSSIHIQLPTYRFSTKFIFLENTQNVNWKKKKSFLFLSHWSIALSNKGTKCLLNCTEWYHSEKSMPSTPYTHRENLLLLCISSTGIIEHQFGNKSRTDLEPNPNLAQGDYSWRKWDSLAQFGGGCRKELNPKCDLNLNASEFQGINWVVCINFENPTLFWNLLSYLF